MLTTVTPSYLFVQYKDDDDIQSFVNVFNAKAQEYVDYFNNLNLPIYTSLQGDLLDWVGAGLYGMPRPVLSSGTTQRVGGYNTVTFDSLTYNQAESETDGILYVTDDDIYKRCLTWNFYKGDGSTWTVNYLKRRVMRFLTGTNGTAPNVDQTYQVSVTFDSNRVCNITLYNGQYTLVNSAAYNGMSFNDQPFNNVEIEYSQPFPPLEFAEQFKSAVDAGVLLMPWQFTFIVNIV